MHRLSLAHQTKQPRLPFLQAARQRSHFLSGQQRPTAPQASQKIPPAPPASLQCVPGPAIQRKQVQCQSRRPPSREVAGGHGTVGRSISVSANHFAVTLKKTVVYHYDVSIRPEPSRTLFRLVFLLHNHACFLN